MFRNAACSVLAVAALSISFGSVASGNLITFENLAIDRLDLVGPINEGAFTYQATVGEGWEIQQVFGNSPSALVTFFNDERSQLGDKFTISLTGGGLFTFQSVDYRTITGSDSDQLTISGFLGGFVTDVLAIDTSTTTFLTLPSGFSGPIDLLQVEVTFLGNNAVVLDNFNVKPIPEPSSSLLVAFSALGLASFSRRRRVGTLLLTSSQPAQQ